MSPASGGAPGPPVHVWTLLTAGETLPADVDLLSDDERERAERFSSYDDRRDYVLAHALLRRALSACAPEVRPTQWAFELGPQGRPELTSRFAATGLRFNLSHGAGAVACVVAHGQSCGIDVEPVRAADGPVRGLFSPAEQRALLATPAAERGVAYARHWTLKEAHAKALGDGLTLAFDQLEVTLDPSPVVRFLGAGQAGEWQWEQWFPSGGHVAALAVAGTRGQIAHHSDMPS